ncbi:molybdenum cofactor guanylyltransferase [Thermaerobacter subterraneus]|uniref:Probable molybdenum cofactor guanylyltransferase n=1 Tax=Thermaerobacter subterraneus DSM 13965 TaxID=867903 RepID=K6Q3I4_9FIRM|nr:molybdenum cofactor guanylyltransferase [Thermaerobacter subterraneus]EKP95634.1 molybdopterin-guanine dinucleotide biosynthesis protein A [Thermaerobacter subterraneus DSM 13965]
MNRLHPPHPGNQEVRPLPTTGVKKAGPLPAAGVILAGGLSRRMGRDKALLPTPDGPLIVHLASILASFCAQVLVVDRPPGRYGGLGLPLVLDRYPGRGPLAGLHAGLEAMAYPYGLFVACDMPGLTPAVGRFLLGEALAAAAAGDPPDAVVPLRDGRPEPLLAVYSRCLAPRARRRLEQGGGPLRSLLDEPDLRVLWVTEDRLRQIDPALSSLTNLNTPDDWDTWIRRMSPPAGPPTP